MQVKDELRVLVEAEVARAIENFKKLSDGVEESEEKTKSLGDQIDAIAKKSMLVSAAITGAGVAAIKFAGENEKLKLSLKNMLGSADEASEVFKEWRELGASPGLSVDEVFTLGRAMVNMGHDTEYATKTMQVLGNIAAGTGVSFSELSGSFERSRAMGNLTTRDLVRLQQQGIPIVKQLAKELGTSEENIRTLAEKGKIGFTELEKAFRSMAAPGGQFAGMMDEMSGTVLEKFSTAADDAKQALASFGEMLLPIATELLDGASSMLRGITEMDDGSKRFVLGMGAVVAASGPAIAAIRGIGTALAFVAANPATLAIGAAVAAAGVLVGIINKQANAYDDLQTNIKNTNNAAKSLLTAFAGGNEEKVLDEKTTRELIKLYPELSSVIRANTSTVRDAAEAQEELNKKRILEGQSSRINNLQKEQALLLRMQEEYELAYNDSLALIRQSDIDEAKITLNQLSQIIDGQINKIHKQHNEINDVLASIGKRYELYGAYKDIDIPVKASVTIPPPPARSSAITAEAKKTWQEWFGEITKVDPKSFNTGAEAAKLYADNFERGLKAQTTIADALSEQLDISDVLRSRQSEIQKALTDLLSIDPTQIKDGKIFELTNSPIENLIKEYKKLGEEAKKIEFAKTIEELTQKINDLGKSERELAFEAELARLGLSAQSEEAQQLGQAMDRLTVAEMLNELRREVQGLENDQYDLAKATLTAAGATEKQIEEANELIKKIEELREKTDKSKFSLKEFAGDLASQFASISLGSLNNELSKIGEAFAKGEFAAENLTQALADMAQQILNQLPGMFLQAGLQLIAQGQWPLGLGFIAASGTSAFISGYVNGKTSANAHGNAFDSSGVIPYAHGGSFTNQIVDKPTFFRFGGKLGVMGEAGPESIMPLRRMANGDLGVAASGGNGANVTVNVINHSGADVRKEEHTDSQGNKQIDIIVGQLVDNHIASGKADRVMSRFGIRPVGV